MRRVIPARIKRRGVEMRLVLDGTETETTRPDPALIRAVARAHKWFDELATGRARSIGEIAENENVSDHYMSRLLPLAFLAPDIVEAIFAGRHPADVTAEALTKQVRLPIVWADQKALLGFERASPHSLKRTD
jgi:hypothetical protein